ncbi:MAG: dihydrodipicolinate synthase family protein, partial [Clostridia bacterium]|nr:dihydrodipicolinate synthase family protein [Clostridia bacterium]
HALSSVTPLYYKYSYREVKHYYEQIAAETDLPVIIYNIPALTGTTLNYDQLCEILSIPGVGGMKFTSSDFFQLERIRAAFPDKVFYNGSDEMLLSGLAAGADGGIGTTYNYQPARILGVYNEFRAGNMAKALEYQAKANETIAKILKYGVLPSSKMLMKLNGMDYGTCREPFMPLDDAAIEDLKTVTIAD